MTKKEIDAMLGDLSPEEKELMKLPRGTRRPKTKAEPKPSRKRQGGELKGPDSKKSKPNKGTKRKRDDKHDKPNKRR